MTKRVVAIGGGHGLSRALQALRLLDVAPTAIVTSADDGGSSGRLRRDLGIIAPGDLRVALLTLARNTELADMLAHRFARGQLAGHALGNLFLVGLAEQADGDFVAALDRAGALLDGAGRVLPATTAAVQLRARISGQEVGGQVRVATSKGRIEQVWLEPEDPPACLPATQAIAEADLVLLGPGSLYTSVIATLLVPDVAAALVATSARLILVGNIREQQGETEGLDAAAHVAALLDHVPGLALHATVLHDGVLGTDVRDPRAGRIVVADVVAGSDGHHPERLAEALHPFLGGPS